MVSAATEHGAAPPCAQRLPGLKRGPAVTMTVNGQTISAHEGESIAAALLAAGWRSFRRTPGLDAPRGFFCGMGACFDCLVTLDGVANVRSCLAEVRAGCVVEATAP